MKKIGNLMLVTACFLFQNIYSQEAKLKPFKDREGKYSVVLPESWNSVTSISGNTEHLLLTPAEKAPSDPAEVEYGLILTKIKNIPNSGNSIVENIENELIKFLEETQGEFSKMHSHEVISQKKMANGIIREIKYRPFINLPEYRQLVYAYFLENENIIITLRSTEESFEENRAFFREAVQSISLN